MREYIEKMLRYARKRLREGEYKDEDERNILVLTIAMFGLALTHLIHGRRPDATEKARQGQASREE